MLVALEEPLKSGNSRERFAAAQLLEWSRRAAGQTEPWGLGGRSGPPDVLLGASQGLEYKKFGYREMDPSMSVDLDLPSAAAVDVHTAEPKERRINSWGRKSHRVGLYVRVSRHDQQTLPATAMRSYAKKRG
ncbi:MAG: hypothetical protein M3Z32_09575 [Acidobacteriota bacterium]|nr:hypothetical protein [Acidobacteriota bacterium]